MKKTEIPVVPCGWRIMVSPVTISEKTAGGIIRPDQVKDNAKLATVVAKVVAVGDQAYGEPDKFSESWVEPGDYVLIERFAGAKFFYKGEEYRLMNDDEIMATTTDPDNITHM